MKRGRTVDTHEAATRWLPQELFHHFQLPPDGEGRAVRHVKDAVVVRRVHTYDVRIVENHIMRRLHRAEGEDLFGKHLFHRGSIGYTLASVVHAHIHTLTFKVKYNSYFLYVV